VKNDFEKNEEHVDLMYILCSSSLCSWRWEGISLQSCLLDSAEPVWWST